MTRPCVLRTVPLRLSTEFGKDVRVIAAFAWSITAVSEVTGGMIGGSGPTLGGGVGGATIVVSLPPAQADSVVIASATETTHFLAIDTSALKTIRFGCRLV